MYPPTTHFALNPDLDTAALAETFTRDGQVSIDGFLTLASANALAAYLNSRDDWIEVLNAGEKVYEIPQQRLPELDAAAQAQLDRSVNDAARHGFQYRYRTIRTDDDAAARAQSGTPLDTFANFLCSETVISFFRTVTRTARIDFADAQATAYGPGHFLTRHDDNVAGKNRYAAYVFGLSEGWRPEWGGLLMFHDENGGVSRVMTPAFNSLRVFAVPVPHSVSYVAPFAGKQRVSVTGWLRAQPGR